MRHHTTYPSPARRAVPAALAGIVVAAHGLVHLMGVALLWRLGQPGNLRYADAVPDPGTTAGVLAGLLWLAAAGAFVTAGVLLAVRRPAWRVPALTGVTVSILVIGLNPAPAVAGLAVDFLVLLGVLLDRRAAR